MQHDLQALHGKVVHAAKKKDETLRRQFTRTQTQLFPNGQPQERELGLVWLLNRYGPAHRRPADRHAARSTPGTTGC